MNPITETLFLFLISFACFASSLEYPEFNYTHHPFYHDDQFMNLTKSPAVIKKYFMYSGDDHRTHGIKFAPKRVSYIKYGTEEPYGHMLDALYVSPASSRERNQQKFIEVTFNNNTRVILLMIARSMQLDSPQTITGLDSKWTGLCALKTKDGGHIDVPASSRTPGNTLFFPRKALAVETSYSANDTLILPHPRTIKVDNVQMEQYFLVFAQDGPVGTEPIPHEYQAIPENFLNRQTQEQVNPEPVEPNETCPDWVHDLYLTPSRDGDVAEGHGELPFWRTWHPMIDPMYWCYFSHEHGSFPGNYKPALGYTAWKTMDKETQMRQQESNEGFKVFAIPLHDQNKYVIFVVHMHLSQPRRFHTRFHTVICAVLDSYWNLELELHMKMDFGFGHGTSSKAKGRKPVPFKNEDLIEQELRLRMRRAGRRFNVLSVDEQYPSSVNRSFSLNCNLTPTSKNKHRILTGIYEQWFGPLNTCSGASVQRENEGLTFDVRDPSTAKKTIDGGKDEPIQKLRGSSVNRFMKVPWTNFTLEAELCYFRLENASVELTVGVDGLFFTDPYFQELHPGPGNNSIRQFISPSFQGILLRSGLITPIHGWGSYMDYQVGKDRNRKSFNVEDAVLQDFN